MRSSTLSSLYRNPQLRSFASVANLSSSPLKRSFLTSLGRRNKDDPTKGSKPSLSHMYEELPTPPQAANAPKEAEDAVEDADGGPYTPSKPTDKSNYGSGSRRAGRNIKKVKELLPLQIPGWFLDANVILREANPSQVNIRHQEEVGKPSVEQADPEELSATEAGGEGKKLDKFTSTVKVAQISPSEGSASAKTLAVGRSDAPAKQQSMRTPKSRNIYEIQTETGLYEFDGDIMYEISSLVSAGLQLPSKQYNNEWTSSKSDLLLSCPTNGAIFFQDELVKHLASVNGADLIRLDPQDIAEIGGNYIEERQDTHIKSLSSLGYDAYRTASELENQDETADDEEDGDIDKDLYKPHSKGSATGAARFDIVLGGNFSDILKSAFKGGDSPPETGALPNMVLVDITKDLKISNFIEGMLGAGDVKRGAQDGVNSSMSRLPAETSAVRTKADANEKQEYNSDNPDPTFSGGTLPRPGSLIVQVRDYLEINSAQQGEKFLETLHEVVRRRRKEGQRILIIGTSASKDRITNFSRSGCHRIQSEPAHGPIRTIITPCSTQTTECLSKSHEIRIAIINMRNLQEMLRRLAPSPIRWDLVSRHSFESHWHIPSEEVTTPESSGALVALGQGILPLDFIHRIAMVTLGVPQGQEGLTSEHVVKAIRTIFNSDTAKVEWMEHLHEHEQNSKSSRIISPFDRTPQESSEDRMKNLKSICNSHEKKLLSGVVDANSIHTTFADVQAPQETIGALKNLTSLSLLRPDAFKYGVLATDRIPGLLLYGPPGTGKTLLAKAVAKESGATVLEVSGSDLNDMYVGEGEKNVKAVFSLAKKLAPCIVFIDEADAILGSRGANSTRITHRELINQFLREWDGMNDLGAFIMVATNRPFDLDDACLRRLPRRLLVDLPSENDREAILRIHLKDENLEPAVSLPNLASQTPFYSGSDLKNLVVAAALSCVREEVEQATSATSTLSPNSSPGSSAINSPDRQINGIQAKRILLARHFTKAMEEISASISEDMSSLAAIRKFDEEFGDRRGRKKKGRAYGFDTVKEGEKKRSDAARVRNR